MSVSERQCVWDESTTICIIYVALHDASDVYENTLPSKCGSTTRCMQYRFISFRLLCNKSGVCPSSRNRYRFSDRFSTDLEKSFHIYARFPIFIELVRKDPQKCPNFQFWVSNPERFFRIFSVSWEIGWSPLVYHKMSLHVLAEKYLFKASNVHTNYIFDAINDKIHNSDEICRSSY